MMPVWCWPLYATSFCLHDFLGDNDWFGAEQVIIPSASSKTAIGLAYALVADDNAPAAIRVTSSGNLEMVRGLGLYDQIITYDQIEAELPGNLPSLWTCQVTVECWGGCTSCWATTCATPPMWA